MSDYDDISIQLTALADGELPPDEADALRRQIDADPALAEEFRQIQSVCSLLGQLPRQTLSPNFAAGVTARLHRKRFVGRFTRIAAAAVVALTTTLIVLHSNDTESDDTLASKTKSSEVRPAPARDELDLSSDKKLGTDRSALDAREEVVAKDTAVPSPEGHVHSPTTKSAEKVIASLESETVRRRAGKPGHLSRVTGGAMNKTNSTPSISEIDTATVETTLPGANWDAPGASPNAKRATIPPLAAPTEPDEIAIAPDITSNEGLLDVHSPREPEAIIASKGESRITFSIGDEPRRSMKKTATPEPPPVATAETVNLYTDNLPREQKALETFFASNRIAFTNVNAPSQTGSKEIIKKIGENQELQYTKVAEADSDDAYETVEYVLTVDDSQLAALNTKLMPARQNFNINVSQMSDTLHRGLQTQADLEERGRVIAMVEKEIATTQRAKLSRPAAKAKTPAKADGWAMSPVADPTTPSA
ncbi:MAG: hypothetical protein HN909_07850, partial [Phycisphaerales bacterium]|nr:hypothetical protein [Phycisphaerales bacterium]